MVEGRGEGNFVRELTHVDVKEFAGERPGHVNILPKESREIDFLDQFFPVFIYTLISEQTNIYAKQKIEVKPDPTWTPTTPKEIKAYFGIRVFMGLV